MLMQKQLEVAQQLNEMLGEALAVIGDSVSGIDPGSINDQKAAGALDNIKNALSKLEKDVEEFNKRLK